MSISATISVNDQFSGPVKNMATAAGQLESKLKSVSGAVGTAGTALKGMSSIAGAVGSGLKAAGSAVSGIGSAVKSAGSAVTSFGSAVGTVGSKLSSIGKAGSVVTGALGAMTASAAKTATEFVKLYESTNIVFSKMLGSDEAASGLYSDILKIAKASTFSQETFLQASKGLVGVGVSAENTTKYMQAITDAVAGFGGSNEQINQLAYAFRKISTAGKISMEEINMMSDGGVNAIKILANQYGLSVTEMRKYIETGTVQADDALAKLAEGIEKGTDGAAGMTAAMEGMAAALKGKSLTGQFDSLGSSIRNFSLALIGINPVLKEGDEGYEENQKHIKQYTAAMAKMNEIIGASVKLFKPVTDGIGSMLEKLIGSDPVFDEATGTWQNAGGILTKLAETIKNMPAVTLPGLSEIPGQLAAIFPGFGKLTGFIDGLKAKFADFWQSSDGALKFTGAVLKIQEGILKVNEHVQKLKDKLAASDSPFLNKIAELLGYIQTGALKAFDALSVIFDALMNSREPGFLSGLAEKLSGLGGVFGQIGQQIKSLTPEQLSQLTGIALKLAALAPGILVAGKAFGMLSGPIKLVGSLIGGVSAPISMLGSVISGAGGLVSSFAGGLGKLAGAASGAKKGLDGIGSFIGNLGKKDKDEGGGIGSLFSSFLDKGGITNLKDELFKQSSNAANGISEGLEAGIKAAKSSKLSEYIGKKMSDGMKLAKGALNVSEDTGLFSGLLGNMEKGAGKMAQGVSKFLEPVSEPITKMFGKIGTFISDSGIGSFLSGTLNFLSPVTSGITSLGTAFLGAVPGLGALAAGIGVLTIALGALNKDNKISDMVDSFFAGFNEKISEIGPKVQEFISNFSNYIVENGPQMAQQGVNLLLSLTGGILETLPNLIKTAGDIVGSLVMGLINAAPTLISTGIDSFTQFITGFMKQVGDFALSAVDILMEWARNFADNLPTIMEKGKEMIVNLFNGIAENLPTIVSAGIETVKNFLSGIIDRLPEMIDTAWTLIQNFYTGIMDNLPQIMDAGMNLLRSLTSTIINGCGELLMAVGELMVKLGTTLYDNRWEILNKMGDVLKAVGESILNAAKTIGINFWNGFVDSMGEFGKVLGLQKIEVPVEASADIAQTQLDALRSQTELQYGSIAGAEDYIVNTIRGQVSQMGIDPNDPSRLPALAESAANMARGLGLNDTEIQEVMQRMLGGYASGTRNALKGLALVGENGPELINFRGGEQVLNNTDTARLLSGAGSYGGQATAAGNTFNNSTNNSSTNTNNSVAEGDINVDCSGWVFNYPQDYEEAKTDVIGRVAQELRRQRQTTNAAVNMV